MYTDADGRFRIDGLVPGLAYDVHFKQFSPNFRSGLVAKKIMVKPGEERELGELKCGRSSKPSEEFGPTRCEA